MVNWKIIGPHLRPDGFGRLLGHGQIRQWQLGTGLALPRRQILDVRMHAERRTVVHEHGHQSGRAMDSALPSEEKCQDGEDPCPLWDEDGKLHIGRSQLGGGPHHHP